MNIRRHHILALLAAAFALHFGAPAHAQGAPLQIGAIVPESWPDRGRGEQLRNGMLLALKTWPSNPVPALLVRDSACKPQHALAATQALLAARVDVVIGGFCIVGPLPATLQAAGVPLVLANAERMSNTTDTTIQLGAVPVNLASVIAARLRTETGLRVTADSACWIDYDARVPPGYDAALCPTLSIEPARWNELAAAYSAAFRQPFTVSAARGYAAMQVALATVKQLRAGSKPAQALRDMKDVDTLLGRVRLGDSRPTGEDTMLLGLAPSLPRLGGRERQALDALLRTKGCGCPANTDCRTANEWSALPFAVQCGGADPPGRTAFRH